MYVGALVAFVIFGGLALILRWVFHTEQRGYWTRRYSGRHSSGWTGWGRKPVWNLNTGWTGWTTSVGWTDWYTEHPPARADYGLLEDVAVVEGPLAASELRGALAAVNIRTTVAMEADGKIRVLVFNDELDRARRVVG